MLHRASEGRGSELAGTVTKLPAPVRLARNPLLRNASYAAVTVARLSRRAAASSRSDGNRVSVVIRPSSTSIEIARASASYTGPGIA